MFDVLANEEWKRFIKSGKIEDYVSYKKRTEEPMKSEISVKSAENKTEDKKTAG